jgi:CelD/BcsL family acetyltransferase involved in cellulose biosynthesis
LQLRAMNGWEEMQPVRSAWEELLAESASDTIFLTWEWLKSWWDAYGLGQPFFLTGWDSDRLAGIAPFYRTPVGEATFTPLGLLRLVGDGSTDSDNLDFIVRRGLESDFLQAALDWLSDHSSEWDVLELSSIPAESGVASALEREAATRRWPCWRRETEHAIVPLPATPEEYFSGLSSNMRGSARSKVRRLESRHRVRLRRCENIEELPGALETLYQMHGSRWQLRDEPGNFLLPERRKFYAAMASEFLKRGWLDFWLLDVDERVVAAEFGFRYNGSYFFLQSGFDSEYAGESVGFVLKVQILRELIHQGVKYYDFLGGSDPYKYRWGAERRAYLKLCLARPRSRGALYLRVLRSTNQSKTWLRERLPASAWQFLRETRRRRARPVPVGSASGSLKDGEE